MNNSEYTTPTPEGAAIVAALAAKFEENPLGKEMDTVYFLPRDKWTKELENKVEALLNQPPQQPNKQPPLVNYKFHLPPKG
jgi:hypothetical protein